MKHSIVRAERPVEDIEELTQADVHQDEEESNVKSKVTFNEENSLVADVGNDDTDPSGLELEEAVPLVSARAVSTPASESSPRPSEALLERPGSAKSEGASSVADNNLGKKSAFSIFKVIKKKFKKREQSHQLNLKVDLVQNRNRKSEHNFSHRH